MLSVELEDKNLQSKINALNAWDGKQIEKFENKFEDKFPRGFQIIIETKRGRKTFQRANKIIFFLHAGINNVKKSIHDAIQDFQDNWFEWQDKNDGEETDSDWCFDPSKISRIFVRFFYAE